MIRKMGSPAARPRGGRPDDERGSMLLVALGILTLLSVMAVAFVTQMTLEKKASGNYVDGVKARLIAEGALERALEEMRYEVKSSISSTRANLYADGRFWFPLEVTADVINPATNDPSRPSIVGVMGQSYNLGADRYKIKLIDTQCQFNLNQSHNEQMFKMMLEVLGESLEQAVISYNQQITAVAQQRGINDYQDLLYPVGDPIQRAEYPRLTDEERAAGGRVFRGVDALWQLRSNKVGQQFATKSELLECFSPSDYRLVRDFVTTQSWFDPTATDARGVTVASALANGDVLGGAVNKYLTGTAANGEQTRRAPININLAMKPVLLSAIAPVAGRRVYVHSRFEAEQGMDQGTKWSVNKNGRREPVANTGNYTQDPAALPNPGSVDKIGYGTRKYLVYLPPIGYQKQSTTNISIKPLATKIVELIDMMRRWNDPTFSASSVSVPAALSAARYKGIFRCFDDWDRFVEEVIAPELLNIDLLTQYPPKILRMNRTGQTVLIQPAEALYGEITNRNSNPGFAEWYRRAYIGMLKAAFNPNDRFSGMNPDQALYVEVDRGNLFYLKSQLDQTSTTPNSNDTGEIEMATMEWCFGSKGTFEIISLGELVVNLPSSVLQQYRLLASNIPDDPNRRPEVRAQEKIRSVIQVFDQVTHSSQRDFLRNGQTSRGAMPDGQEYFGYPRRDGDPDASRYNVLTMPVDERLWLPGQIPPPAAGPAYRAEEYGGVVGAEASDIAMGWLQLKPLYYTTEDAFDPSTTIYPWHVGRFKDRRADTLFELRNDYRRLPTTVNQPNSVMIGQGLGDLSRVARLVPNVAGGRTSNPDGISYPPSDGIFKTRPVSSFAVPLPPQPLGLARYGPRWLTSDHLADPLARWVKEFAYPDGLYFGDDRRTQDRSRDFSMTFLNFRAANQEVMPVGVPANAGRQDLSMQRKSRGTAGATPWAQTPNIHANRGAVSFWYKPNFDWDDQQTGNNDRSGRYCGLFASTHVAETESTAPRPPQGIPAASDNSNIRSMRGTQMFVMRSTNGWFRVVRLYYELAGSDPPGANAQQANLAELPICRNPNANHPGMAGAFAAFKKPNLTIGEYKQAHNAFFTTFNADIASGKAQNQGYVMPPYFPWPPREMFLPPRAGAVPGPTGRQVIDEQMNATRIRRARYDAWVSPQIIGELKAHNWYHLAVVWDDALSQAELYVDGRKTNAQVDPRGDSYDAYDWSEGSNGGAEIKPPQIEAPQPGQASASITYPAEIKLPTFVRLNMDIDPFQMGSLRDEISIGGFTRLERKLGGVFKHNRHVSLPANGTIDDVCIFNIPNTNTTSGGSLPNPATNLVNVTRYFQDGGWTQRVDLRDIYDSNNNPIRILGAYVEGYLPHRVVPGTAPRVIYDNGASIGIDVSVQPSTLQWELQPYKADTATGRITQWSSSNGAVPIQQGTDTDTQIKGPVVQFTRDTLVGRDQLLVYRVYMTAGSQQRGPTGLLYSGMSTPIIDSITFVYQLPKRRILIKERVFD